MRFIGILMLVALAAASCAGTTSESMVTFGADDTTCGSVELAGDADDRQPIQDAVACLLAEIEAGNPAIVDFSLGTVEGDQIFTRYAFDGENILIVSDDRLDEFGSGSVAAAVCGALVSSPVTVPTGADCEAVAHGGFTDADETAG